MEVDYGNGPDSSNVISYPNVPETIGIVVSVGKASYEALDSVLGIEDLYDLLEIIKVDAHNRRELNKEAEKGK